MFTGISPQFYFLLCSYDNQVMDLPHSKSKNAPRIDTTTDRFLNNRLLDKPKFDKFKFIEFVRFYNRLFEYGYEERNILSSWKDIKISKRFPRDTISDELKRQIQPLSVDSVGDEIRVKLYVWQHFERDLIEMIFIYKNGQFSVTNKILGKFGEYLFIL